VCVLAMCGFVYVLNIKFMEASVLIS
jgi:hypothetical protein